MADQPSLNIAPELPISPEEDATLQAIEAMEAKSVDLDTPAVVPVVPVVTQPVAAPPAPPAPVLPPQPVAPATAPQPVVTVPEVKKQVPANAAEAIAQELEKAPQSAMFQFFVKQKPSRNTLIFAAVGIGLAVLIAIGSFFLIQSV